MNGKLLIAVFSVFLLLIASKYTPLLVVFLLMALLSYAGFVSAMHLARQAKWLSKWEIVRAMRSVRKAVNASPVALVFYALCLGLTSITVCIFIVTESVFIFSILGILIGIVLCVATLLDWYARLHFVVTIKPIRRFAKWGLAFLSATTIFVSTVVAKQLTNSISLVDPSSMPEFVRIASAFIFPFALSVVLLTTLTILMIAQYVILLIGVLVTIPTQNVAMLLSQPKQNQSKELVYKLLYGKKRSKNQPWWGRLVDGVQHFLRPVGTWGVAIVVIFFGVSVLNLAGHIPKKYLQQLLVMTEYRNPHLCENIAPLIHVVYLQNGYVSVATPDVDGYKFSVEKCHK
jgi:hypothetical protein